MRVKRVRFRGSRRDKARLKPYYRTWCKSCHRWVMHANYCARCWAPVRFYAEMRLAC